MNLGKPEPCRKSPACEVKSLVTYCDCKQRKQRDTTLLQLFKFTVLTANYDLENDMLTATVDHVSDSKTLRYDIEAYFSCDSFAIHNTAESKLITMPCHAAPLILAAFMSKFYDAYCSLDPSASPADVFDADSEFCLTEFEVAIP